MALDEALLEAMPRLRHPILRFYGWTMPAASFGYFQKFTEVERLTSLRPLVRRPTAGGIVPHDADWTYSLVFPTIHEWYALSAMESYTRVHAWIQTAFAGLGLETQLAPAQQKSVVGQCFIGHEQADLLWNGRKIAGAAQRRRKDGLLVQGSIQPPSLSLKREQWERAMRDMACRPGHVFWEPFGYDSLLVTRSLDLAKTKYSQASHNKRR